MSVKMIAVVLHRGDHRFHRLFAELLGAMLRALVEQLSRIGRLAARRGAGIDGGGQIVNGETRHRQKLSTRAHQEERHSLRPM